MYLAPILNGECLNNSPPRVEYLSKKIIKVFETPLGNRRYHTIGYQFTFSLIWDLALCTEVQWEVLREIVNANSTLTFIPYPDKYYSSSFTVKEINGLGGLSIYKYIGFGYRGKVILETIDPIQEIPKWI